MSKCSRISGRAVHPWTSCETRALGDFLVSALVESILQVLERRVLQGVFQVLHGVLRDVGQTQIVVIAATLPGSAFGFRETLMSNFKSVVLPAPFNPTSAAREFCVIFTVAPLRIFLDVPGYPNDTSFMYMTTLARDLTPSKSPGSGKRIGLMCDGWFSPI